MSKRFTDSEKFRDSWYRKLSPTMKCFWEYLLSECNNAGVIDIDFESASFHIGAEVTEADLKIYDDRVIKLFDGKYFIPKFIQFQQGELNTQNSAHKPIIECLKKYGYTQGQPLEEFVSSLMAHKMEVLPPLEGGSMGGLPTISNSNSNSNGNSKIINLNNININNINNTIKEEKLKIEEVVDWKSLFLYWEQNKHGGKYKNADSRNRMLAKLQQLTNNDFNLAKDAIFFCIDNKYQGFTNGSELYYKPSNKPKEQSQFQRNVDACKEFLRRNQERQRNIEELL